VHLLHRLARLPAVNQCTTAILVAEIVYGGLRDDLERTGKRLVDIDRRIAAIDLSYTPTLVTGNVCRFEQVPGLRIENRLEAD